MNYYQYYIGSNKAQAQTFRLTITAHLLHDDNEVVHSQTLNIRARDPHEALEVSFLVRDSRLNQLYSLTAISDLSGRSQLTNVSDPIRPDVKTEQEADLHRYQVTIIREAGHNPITGTWLEYAEDRLNIHAPNEQQAHRLADFISGLPFYGQVKKTLINGMIHLSENY